MFFIHTFSGQVRACITTWCSPARNPSCKMSHSSSSRMRRTPRPPLAPSLSSWSTGTSEQIRTGSARSFQTCSFCSSECSRSVRLRRTRGPLRLQYKRARGSRCMRQTGHSCSRRSCSTGSTASRTARGDLAEQRRSLTPRQPA